MSDPTDYLGIAIAAMTKKAWSPKNLSKGSWTSMSDDELIHRVHEEIVELIDVIDDDAEEALLEAADVMAFCAMRVHNERRRKSG